LRPACSQADSESLFFTGHDDYFFFMYTIRVNAGFSAAHHLREYKGKCENPHGHNWRVSACVAGEALNTEGMLIDFGELKKLLRDICAELDHTDINAHSHFTQENPTAENIARWIFERLAAVLSAAGFSGTSIRVKEITVEETDGSVASYSGQAPH
jgi:6-pyruvoyltetrahydropterin/6-carboxytetrahydropterin synthase